MFMCNRCCMLDHLSGSYGPCEGCRRVAVCSNCHHANPKPMRRRVVSLATARRRKEARREDRRD